MNEDAPPAHGEDGGGDAVTGEDGSADARIRASDPEAETGAEAAGEVGPAEAAGEADEAGTMSPAEAMGEPGPAEAASEPEAGGAIRQPRGGEPSRAGAQLLAFGWFGEVRKRWWGQPLLVSVTALAVIAVLTLATIVQSPSAKAGASVTPAAETSTPPPTSALTASPMATTPTPTPKATIASPTPPPTPTISAPAALADAVNDLDVSGRLSVAVADLDPDDGGTATYNSSDDTEYDTASIVKVDILSTLLLQHQHAGTKLTEDQRELATEMIEQSDNDAALSLWEVIGGADGLDHANATLGLHHTTGGTDDLWGLTQTTVADQIALLRDVFGDDSPLSSASRAYISGLMESVTDGQRWGVSAADSDGTGYALKNGWLERTATSRWDINSIGEVTYDGHRLLISVLSSGQSYEQSAIAQVEKVALAAAKAYVTSTT
jgi:Beta-lactamase enzyme family